MQCGGRGVGVVGVQCTGPSSGCSVQAVLCVVLAVLVVRRHKTILLYVDCCGYKHSRLPHNLIL